MTFSATACFGIDRTGVRYALPFRTPGTGKWITNH